MSKETKKKAPTMEDCITASIPELAEIVRSRHIEGSVRVEAAKTMLDLINYFPSP